MPDPKDTSKAWPWTDITAALDAVRKDPSGALHHAEGVRRSFAGRTTDSDAPLELALDMPGGSGLAFAGPPPDPKNVVIPPLPAVFHDKDFFDSIKGRGFHNGLLDNLGKFYK